MSNPAHLSNFEKWQQGLPEFISKSPLIEFKAYPKALFIHELVRRDCEILLKDTRGKAIAEQIIRSAGSIGAIIEEGYGRGFGRDYARFLIVALGSARETQGWYIRSRQLLSQKVIEHRIKLLDEIISMLIITSQQQRHKANVKK